MNENFQFLFSSLQRLSNFPLDSTSIFKTRDDLHEYIETNKTIYEGQIVAVLDEENVFVLLIDKKRSTLNKPVFFEKRVGYSEEEIRSFANEVAENLDKVLEASLLAKIAELKANLDSEVLRIDSNINEFKTTVEETYATKDDVETKYNEVSDALKTQSNKITNLENITKDIKETTIKTITGNITELRTNFEDFKKLVPNTYATIDVTEALKKDIQANNKFITDVAQNHTKTLKELDDKLIGKINEINTNLNTLETNLENTNIQFESYKENTDRAISENKKAIEDHKVEFEVHTENINNTLTEITNELNENINTISDKLASDYYTKIEVNKEIEDAISKVDNLIFEVINNKNQIVKSGIIYLYKPDSSKDFYEQWIYDNKLGPTKIGTTAVDFSQFASKEDLSNTANTLRNETQEIRKAIDADIKAYKNEINSKQELVNSNIVDIQNNLNAEIERSKEVDRLLESKLLTQNNTISILRSDVEGKFNNLNSRIDNNDLKFNDIDSRFARDEESIRIIQDTYASKSFVSNLIGEQRHLTTKVIDDLDQVINYNVIYLYKEKQSDFYEQWILDSETKKPINIGTTNANLDGYATDEDVDSVKNSITLTSNEVNTLKEKIALLEDKLENYTPGTGGSCDCENLSPMEPYTPEEIEKEFKDIIGECSGVQDNEDVFERVTEGAIENLFNEVNGDCDGVEDNEEVIESIPLDDIESVFNEVNEGCDGVEDDIEITEGISQNDIEDLFNSINNC